MYVMISLSSGYKILRGRRRGNNYYKVILPTGEVETYTGFGFKVPERIMNIHCMFPLNIDDGETVSLNITEQDEPVFLFSSTPPKKSRVIGGLTGADKADGTLALLGQWGNSKSKYIKVTEKSIKDMTGAIEGFSFLEVLKSNVLSLKEIVSSYDTTETTIHNLDSILTTYNEILSTSSQLMILTSCEELLNNESGILENMTSVVNAISNISDAVTRFTSMEDIFKTQSRLVELSSSIKQFETSTDNLINTFKILEVIKRLQRTYVHLNDVLQQTSQLLSIEDNEIKLEEILSDVEATATQLKGITDVLNSYTTLVTRYSDTTKVILNLEKDYTTLCESYTEALHIAGVCPICNSIIK